MIKKFSLPNYYAYGNNVLHLAKYRKSHPQYFYQDRIIDSVYDAHPSVLWTGGRNTKVENMAEIPMSEIIKKFDDFPAISLRHVFTNSLITPELTLDYRCNQFMRNYVRKQDAVIAASPILIDYLEKTYPKVPIIYSTTMNITDLHQVNEMTQNRIYVMNYNYNNDNEYINQLEHKENIEILCAEPCNPNCPTRMIHYDAINRKILELSNRAFLGPSKSEYRTFDEVMKLPHAITNERVDELSEMGIQYFKISGRTLAIPTWLYTILYYLVEPEYLLHVYLDLLNTWW